MFLVDSHCHLYLENYSQDLNAVIDRALGVGVGRFVVPGLDLQTSRQAVELAEKYSSVYAAVGVHPNYANSFQTSQMPEFELLLNHTKVVAVGEIGTDYYHNCTSKSTQFEVLDSMLQLATQATKPLILHSRNSLEDLVNRVLEWVNKSRSGSPKLNGIFHAYEGNTKEAQLLIEHNFLLGVGGPITYKNASVKRDVFSIIDLNYVVLETDAPFLSPHPHRGTRNEPGLLPLIAARLSEIKNCSLERVANITTKNVQLLFDWNI